MEDNYQSIDVPLVLAMNKAHRNLKAQQVIMTGKSLKCHGIAYGIVKSPSYVQ